MKKKHSRRERLVTIGSSCRSLDSGMSSADQVVNLKVTMYNYTRAKEPTFKLMQCQKRNTAQPDTILFPPGLIATVKAVNKLKPWQTNKAVKPDIDSGY